MLKISFVLPVKNGQKFIEKTIESLLNQTYENTEIVVVNDHSEDNTLEILTKLSKTNKKIVVYNLTDKTGISAGRNLGTKMATGDIILPVDADDPSFSKRAELSVYELECNKADIFYANVERYYIETKERVLRHFQPYDEKMLRSINIIAHGASAFRKKVFETIGSYDESIKIGEDYDFFLSAQEKGFKFCSKNVAVSQYSMHEGQITSSPDPEKIAQRQMWNKIVREKHKIYNVDPDYIKKNGEPSIIDFYLKKNYEIWFAAESIPERK